MIGHVDITVANEEEEFEGKVTTWQEVMIHGDPDGLRSLSRILLELADNNQEEMKGLPVGAREHYHLSPSIDISKSSAHLLIGRLDAKGTGDFYGAYIEKDKN